MSPRPRPVNLDLDLPALVPSWEVSLRADRKAKSTITAYVSGVQCFINWCCEQGLEPAVERDMVRAFLADQSEERGLEAATVRSRHQALRRFSAWLEEEGELDADPLLSVKPPKVDTKITRSLTADEVSELVRACSGKDFRDRRDEALIRLMIETGMRAGEVIALTVDDVDVKRFIVQVVRGKGGRGRVVPISPQTTRAIDRYMRMRRTHRLSGTPALWLGERGKGLAYFGLRDTLRYRAELAGIKDLHPHMLRHTAASRWLAANGSENGLMAVAGWQTRSMLDRYTRSTAAARAAEEAKRLNLGEM
jgi:site-specific recombinase XerD